MSKAAASRQSPVASEATRVIETGLARRYRAERRFRRYGLAAIVFAGLMLGVLLMTIVRPGISGFFRHELQVVVDLKPVWEQQAQAIPVNVYDITLHSVSAMAEGLENDRISKRQLYALIGTFASFDVQRAIQEHAPGWGARSFPPTPDDDQMTVWIPLSDAADQYLKGHSDPKLDPTLRTLNERQLAWLDAWKRDGFIRRTLNPDFFTRGDSRAPEGAGFMGAIAGSLWSLLICMAVAFPIAIAAAVTLEEFAKKTRLAEVLEVLINNLAAVPSIIYGLLGLSVYLQWFQLPRSSPLVGGLTLAMLILPVMIIAARAAIRAVPPSMRQAATALGATPLQVVRHHVLPYAVPGILTGTILSVCRALGETAPLLMIGMVAFVADIPRGVMDPATTMPVEIYLWASSPEPGFIEKTSSGILVLLAILLLLNALAIRLRNATQRIWH